MTNIEYRKGNLFGTDSQVICQGCNTLGKMGKGIALLFKERYPEMYQEYRNLCFTNRFIPGDLFVYKIPEGYHMGNTQSNIKYIFNLGTQPKPGPYAKVSYIRESLLKGILYAREHNLSSIALPQIGCGLGGLNWNREVKPLLEELSASHPDITLIVYSL